jgi:hypothetical protein
MNRYIIFFYFHYYFYLNTRNFYIMRWSEYNYNFQTAWATWHSVTSIIWVDWYRPPRLHVPDRRPWHSDEIHVRCVNCEVESNVRERVVPPISCWFHFVCPNCTGVLLVTLWVHTHDARRYTAAFAVVVRPGPHETFFFEIQERKLQLQSNNKMRKPAGRTNKINYRSAWWFVSGGYTIGRPLRCMPISFSPTSS